MPKCFFTGIDLRLEDASVLDRGGARRALRALKERVAALERLIRELGQFDTVEVYDAKTRGNKTCSQHRMIAPTIAAALAAGWPESPVFVNWRVYVSRRPPVYPPPGKAAPPQIPRHGKADNSAADGKISHAPPE